MRRKLSLKDRWNLWLERWPDSSAPSELRHVFFTGTQGSAALHPGLSSHAPSALTLTECPAGGTMALPVSTSVGLVLQAQIPKLR